MLKKGIFYALLLGSSLIIEAQASWRQSIATSLSPVLQSQYTQYATRIAVSLAALIAVWPTQAYTYWQWQDSMAQDQHLPHAQGIELTYEIINKRLLSWRSFTPYGQKGPFLFGVGTSSIQVDAGHTATSGAWGKWVTAQSGLGKMLPDGACNAQKLYKQDIQLIKALGANAYRFSTSWSLVQPDGPASWDEEVLNYYADLCDELVKNGIKPVITLHHYDDPAWFFECDYQGFESEQGIQAYVKYCEKIAQKLIPHGVYLFFTFNSPEAYALNGYMEGTRPPGYKDRSPYGMARVVSVTKNLLEAHRRAYSAIQIVYGKLKTIDQKSQKPYVGILKNIYQIDPWIYQVGPLSISSPLDKLLAWIANNLQDRTFYNFFASHDPCLDFIGLNYYSHGFMKTPKPRPDPLELQTNNPQYTVSAEGLHRALHTIWEKVAQPLDIPIYVTENGVAAGDNDQLRATFIKRYLYAITQAIAEGIPILGYFYWSFMDNYEWGTYSKCYGLYKVNRSSPELTRTLRPGAQPFIDTALNYQEQYKTYQ